MKKFCISFFLLCFLCPSILIATAQSFVNISSGISRDVNNTNETFYHIPLSVQWKPSRGVAIFEFDYDIPLAAEGKGNAYTLNPSLPQEVTLAENIRSYVFTASLGFRIHLYENKNSNSIYLNVFPFSFCTQQFDVNYKGYDKVNYEILNPDVNLKRTSIAVSMAAVYNFHQNLMLMLHLQSPLFGTTGKYPLSYKFVAPLQLTFGYNFYYN